MASLNSMLQKELHNEVPDAVLRQCPECDRVLVENVLRLAQYHWLRVGRIQSGRHTKQTPCVPEALRRDH
jgi:hypothetical protein